MGPGGHSHGSHFNRTWQHLGCLHACVHVYVHVRSMIIKIQLKFTEYSASIVTSLRAIPIFHTKPLKTELWKFSSMRFNQCLFSNYYVSRIVLWEYKGSIEIAIVNIEGLLCARYCILMTTLWIKYYYYHPNFIDKKTEVQEDQANPPGSHS